MSDPVQTPAPSLPADIKSEIVNELRTLAGTKTFWFLAGVFMSGNDVPGVVNALRTFVGV